MKILVTGSLGYIGSHLCRLLTGLGHNVSGWDNLFHNEANIDYCNTVNMDFTHIPYYRSDRYDVVVHLGGRSVVPQSMIEPAEYYRVNTMGTDNLLNNISTDHFIFASTSSAFEMKSPYARSKVAAEDIIKQKAKGYTIFRFFNVSGTDGVNHQLGKASHLIRRAALAATDKIDSLEIFGTDYDTRDGTCIRDYIHVLDLCDSIIAAIDHGPMNTPYECLGSKQGWTVRDVIASMEYITNKKINTIESPRRAGDAEVCLVDELSSLCNITRSMEQMCLDQYELERKRNT